MHIIMVTCKEKLESTESNLFFWLISSDLRHKKMFLESLNISLKCIHERGKNEVHLSQKCKFPSN